MTRFLLIATLCASGSLVTGCTEKPAALPPPPVEVRPAPVPAPAPAAAPAPEAAAWQPFEAENFTVELPGVPTVKEGVEQTKAGPVKTTTWQLQTANAFYAVSTADYPKGSMKTALPSKVLEGARDGAMANVGGTVDKDFAVFLDSGTPKLKYPGREFDGTTQQGIKMAARLFLVDDRLYQMISVSPIGAFNAADFAKLADSFKLKAAAPAAARPGKRPRK